MPLSFCGGGNFSGGTSSWVVAIEWQLMALCAAVGFAWLIVRPVAIIAKAVIFRDDRAAWEANRAKFPPRNKSNGISSD
jgi:hypothetical protein